MKTEDVGDLDVWREKIQQDITEIKAAQSQSKHEQENIKSDINTLKLNDQLQQQDINTLKESLNDIKDDTNFIRRKITGAIITAGITSVVAGLVGIAIATIYG